VERQANGMQAGARPAAFKPRVAKRHMWEGRRRRSQQWGSGAPVKGAPRGAAQRRGAGGLPRHKNDAGDGADRRAAEGSARACTRNTLRAAEPCGGQRRRRGAGRRGGQRAAGGGRALLWTMPLRPRTRGCAPGGGCPARAAAAGLRARGAVAHCMETRSAAAARGAAPSQGAQRAQLFVYGCGRGEEHLGAALGGRRLHNGQVHLDRSLG
jgi:hypothetical protein